MDAINLYVLCQAIDLDNFGDYKDTLTKSGNSLAVKKEEIITLKSFLSELLSRKIQMSYLDNFIYGFSIPQISKEFDLLKIYENGPVINIELKSRMIDEKKIEYQLKKNQYYLSHFKKKIISFTYVMTETGSKVFSYDGVSLKESNISEILFSICQDGECYHKDIETLFRAKDYLISPINTPNLFIDGNYYLTDQQENIKNEILKNIADGKRTIWGITGGAGTGKTLLLYDIAKQLSNDKKVCIIHSGMLAKGHKFIGEKITNIDVISARDCNLEKILEYDCILVDESQRLYEIDFNSVITAFKNFNRTCIFAYDFYQVLSWKEEKLNIPDKLRSLDCFCEKHITEKIRTNKEIVSFIKHAIYLKNKPDDNIKYDCIDILYAIDYECATSIIEHYVYNKGYEFIAYTPSRVSSVLDYFKGYKNTHEVIGQEFDNVIFNMDDNFQYAEDGHLQGKMHPNPNYIFYKLWFQGVSRAREKLCILVIGNEELFKKLLSGKNKFK